MNIESMSRRIEQSVSESVTEGKGTVEIIMEDAMALLFLLPKVQALIETAEGQ